MIIIMGILYISDCHYIAYCCNNETLSYTVLKSIVFRQKKKRNLELKMRAVSISCLWMSPSIVEDNHNSI